MLSAVKIRKAANFGHIMCNDKYCLLQDKIESNRGQGRRQIFWLKNLRQWTGISSRALFRVAVSKVIWTNMIAYIQRE